MDIRVRYAMQLIRIAQSFLQDCLEPAPKDLKQYKALGFADGALEDALADLRDSYSEEQVD